MTCIKTGFHGYIEPYGEYVYGDAFSIEVGDGEPLHGQTDIYWFRICERSFEPLQPTLHFRIHDYRDWFDKDKTSQSQDSTLISDRVTNLGYEGVPL